MNILKAISVSQRHSAWKRAMWALLFAIPVLAMATTAHATADFITGYGWVTAEALVGFAGTGASATSLASTTCHGGVACTFGNADVTFTTNGIGFGGSTFTTNTIAAWLASNTFGARNVVENVAGTTALDPTIWEFVGNASFISPDPFTIEHDDGVTFVVNGQTVIDHPAPTSPTSTGGTYTGAAGGSLAFSLIYAECCSPPAVLQTNLVGPSNPPIPPLSTVPEPATLTLLGLGLGVAGLGLRRRKRS